MVFTLKFKKKKIYINNVECLNINITRENSGINNFLYSDKILDEKKSLTVKVKNEKKLYFQLVILI